MTTEPQAYYIQSWSGRVFRARKHYVCRNCGGIIPKGVKYRRDVVRLGKDKKRDWRQSRHYHLDCDAPWYQVDDTHHLKAVAKVQKTAPLPETPLPYIRPMVVVDSKDCGHLVWQLPRELERVVGSQSTTDTLSTIAEYETCIATLLSALTKAIGDKKTAYRLSHLIKELAQLAR